MRLAVLLSICVFLASCASSALPKPIKYACTKSGKAFTDAASEAMRKSGFEVKEISIERGEVVGFREENSLIFGGAPITTGPYRAVASSRNDTLTLLIFSVRDDGKTLVRSWDEQSTDEFEKSQYLPLITALRELCRN
jgi:hypothetical protein